MLFARYFFSQLWCEFTKEVITEFFNEDIANKTIENEKRNGFIPNMKGFTHFGGLLIKLRPQNDGIVKNFPQNIDETIQEEWFAQYSARQQSKRSNFPISADLEVHP
jgi:hypothetical protein